MDSKWYVIQTYSSQESRIADDINRGVETKFATYSNDKKLCKLLLESIAEAKSPQKEVVSMKNGKAVKSIRKDFPCYVLVDMVLNEESKSYVQKIPGVLGFLGGVRNPQPIKEAEMERIMGRDASQETVVEAPENPFRVDDAVKITVGSFKGFGGEITKMHLEKGKATVNVMVFGRATPVEVDFSQIELLS
jgi:transcriptional antiterminator NusG